MFPNTLLYRVDIFTKHSVNTPGAPRSVHLSKQFAGSPNFHVIVSIHGLVSRKQYVAVNSLYLKKYISVTL